MTDTMNLAMKCVMKALQILLWSLELKYPRYAVKISQVINLVAWPVSILLTTNSFILQTAKNEK